MRVVQFPDGHVYLGDCLNVLPTLERQVHLIVMDPPYFTTDIPFDKWPLDMRDVSSALLPVLTKTGWMFCFGVIEMLVPFFDAWRRKFEYVWVKPNIIPATYNTMRPFTQHELIYAFIHKDLKVMGQLTMNKEKLRRPGDPYTKQRKATHTVGRFVEYNRRIPVDKQGKIKEFFSENEGYREGSTVLFFANKNTSAQKDHTKHPTQKPTPLIQLMIEGYSHPGDTVLDPFAGSGTTAIAALNSGRRFVCIEKDPEWFEATIQRIERWYAERDELNRHTTSE